MFIKLNQTNSDNQYQRAFLEIEGSISCDLESEVSDHISNILDDVSGRPNSFISSIDTDVERISIQDKKPELPDKEKKENRGPYSPADSISELIVYSDGTVETPEYFFR